jgi:hypothetical protein
VNRTLSVIVNPNRYRSKAAEAFTEEILPQFTNRAIELSPGAAEQNGQTSAVASVPEINGKASVE